jgi:hypothetical protein
VSFAAAGWTSQANASHAASARVFSQKIMALSGERHTSPAPLTGRTAYSRYRPVVHSTRANLPQPPPIAPIFIDAFTSTLIVLEKRTREVCNKIAKENAECTLGVQILEEVSKRDILFFRELLS